MIFASIVGALVILAILSWKDLNDRTRRNWSEEPHEPLPTPPAHLSTAQITSVRKLYVNAFWFGIVGNLLLWMMGLTTPAIDGFIPLSTVLLLLFFLYASFRILRTLGHDPLTSALLCLLPLVPFFSLIQYLAIGQRCRQLFGPLGAVPGAK
ncbi:MAG: hypothetical protein ACOY94_21405 [Bacillota bacterium]